MSLLSSYTEVNGKQAEQLAAPTESYPVEVKPPREKEVPATIEGFVRGILELQTDLLGVRNTSPTVAYEIHRPRNDRLRLQFCIPHSRLERRTRAQLSNEIPGVGFDKGTTTLPVRPGDSIGGGILPTGRDDQYPLETAFDSPPIDRLVALLNRHAMKDTRVIVQILFQPIVGRSIRRWWQKRQAHKTVEYLRDEKQQLLGSRDATPRERKQANVIEEKIGQRRFWVSIRIGVIGAEKYTPSRVKELAGAFHQFENPESSQYLNTKPIRGIRQKRFIEFFQAIRDREFGGYSLRFQARVPEVATLVSIPSIEQENLEYAQP